MTLTTNALRLFDHSLDRDANVLDVAVLYAERQSGFNKKPTPRGVCNQLRECLLNALDHIRLRRGLDSRLNHGVTIADVTEHFYTTFGPPGGRQGDKEQGRQGD